MRLHAQVEYYRNYNLYYIVAILVAPIVPTYATRTHSYYCRYTSCSTLARVALHVGSYSYGFLVGFLFYVYQYQYSSTVGIPTNSTVRVRTS